jgi:hypothetical protein
MLVTAGPLESAKRYLAAAEHEQPVPALNHDLLAAKISYGVLERQPKDESARSIYNFAVARVVQEPMLGAPAFAAIAIDVENIDDHRQRDLVVESGVNLDWANERTQRFVQEHLNALREVAASEESDHASVGWAVADAPESIIGNRTPPLELYLNGQRA